MKLLIIFLLFSSPLFAVIEISPCEGKPTSVQIDTTKRRLYLCEAGNEVESYKVALGSGGVGKQMFGDGKTPIGTYELGKPRPSQKFGTFIPVGYPTAAQKKQGFTGDAIGIHGPVKWWSWLGWLVSRYDWTDGCIGTSSMGSIEEISKFVDSHRPIVVTIF